MHLIDPEIMEVIRGASAPLYVTGLSLGLAVWLFGWWGHRFWIVLFTTVIAGLIGLSTAKMAGVQPFVAGLLLALAAGMLALALCRLFAFAAGGFAAWLLIRSILPGWDEPLIAFLAGGLIGLFLFRPWLMALTSLAGSLVMIYAGLGLFDLLGKLDAQAWVEQRALLLNWMCGGVTILGWVLQFVLDRWRMNREYEKHEQLQLRDAEEQLRDRLRRRFRWWGWTRHTPLDKAA